MTGGCQGSGRGALGAIALLAPLAACIGHLEIAGAPCPCPDGFTCCATLAACITADQSCPSTFPPSSSQACDQDDDCPTQEICEVWSAQGHTGLFGPGLCRRQCEPDIPCSAGERCAPVHHDGQAIEALAILPACVPSTRTPECRAISCQDCPSDRVGGTFCRDGGTWGCLFGAHLTCGLTCEAVLLDPCENHSCVERDGYAECVTNDPVDNSPCDLYPCDACEANAVGGVRCAGREIVACTAMPYVGESCDEICVPRSVEICAGECTEQEAPICAP